MYSDNLEELISMALEDGTLTEQKRNMIIRRAEKEGEDPEEVMMVVDSRFRKLGKNASMVKNSLVYSHDNIDENVNMDEDDVITNENSGIYVSSEILPKVLKLVKKYNAQASKWGYSIIEYDDENQMIYGSFEEKNEAKGFWNESKEAFRNGYLKEDFEKIIKMCGQKF